MASLLKPVNTAVHATPSNEVSSEIFNTPKGTLDQPCDVVLVVEDGKEFKAHRQVLSEASTFFEKLLNSDMKESKEGIVRLEMFSESVMGNTLKFIYTGNVQILTEDNARDLIVMADYLFLQDLKSLAGGFLVNKLQTLDCISTYYFSERYRCEELVSKTKQFILTNFTSLYESHREQVLNMSSKEVQMWISSDKIHVCAEEDVFKIILAWINHDKSNRKKHFPELFRQVRLVYVSRDFLCSDIVTNDLVNDNEDCLDLVEDAMRLIESRNYDNLPVTPRKSLTTPVLVAICPFNAQGIQCYFPQEDRWYSLGEMPFYFGSSYFVSCHGKIYGKSLAYRHEKQSCESRMVSYNPYSNNWMSLPYKEDRDLKQIFVGSDDEMYALVSEACAECWRCYRQRQSCIADRRVVVCDKEQHFSFITKYKPESNSWEDVSSFCHMNLRQDVCIVAKDNFIYFIGGAELRGTGYTYLADVDRYDLCKNQWDKVADIQMARSCATGAVANGKIVIDGGVDGMGRLQCEMFNETTNEWHYIPRFGLHPHWISKLLSVDGRLYALATQTFFDREIRLSVPYSRKVECYDPDKNQWNQKTKIPANMGWVHNACSMRIFKGFLGNKGKKKNQRERTYPSA